MRDRGNEKLRPLQLLRANSSLTHKVKTPPEEKRGRQNVFGISGQTGDVRRVPGELWSRFSTDTSLPMPQVTHAMNGTCVL